MMNIKLFAFAYIMSIGSICAQTIEEQVKAADLLWKERNLPGAVSAYQDIIKKKVLSQDVGSLIYMRLAESQYHAHKLNECKTTLQQMQTLAYVPECHQLRMNELQILLAGGQIDYKTSLPVLSHPFVSFYVRANNPDSDEELGTEERPFRSIEKALEAVEDLRKFSVLPDGPIEIVLLDKEYFLEKTIKLEHKHSGTYRNPLVIRSVSAVNRTKITGGVCISNWRKEKKSIITRLLPKSAKGKVLVADLSQLKVDVGNLQFGGFTSLRAKADFGKINYSFKTMPVPELFYEGARLGMARWPDQGDTIVSIKRFKDVRCKKWVKEGDVWLHGYWLYLYADAYEKLETLNEDGSLSLALPTNRQGFGHVNQGFRSESKWHAINLLSEMDKPGEWKISSSQNKIWLYPPESFDYRKTMLSINGLAFDIRDCDYVTLRNLDFQYLRGDAIFAKSSDNLSFIDCKIRDVSGLGIQILGGRRHLIHSVHIESMGRGGIYLESGNKETLESSESVIENCYIADLAHIDRTYTPGILLDGVGIKVQYCLFGSMPSSAIRIEGNDMLIQYNEFSHCVQESNDQGAIDVWGNPLYRGTVIRRNYFHDIGCPIRMAGGIRFDDAISGQCVSENIFRRSSTGIFGAVQLHGGHFNRIEGNLFFGNRAAVSHTLWGENRWRKALETDDTVSKELKKDYWKNESWKKKYLKLQDMWEYADENWLLDNKIINGEKLYDNNSIADELQKLHTVHLFNNAIISEKIIDDKLEAMEEWADPWHFIPIREIGLQR